MQSRRRGTIRPASRRSKPRDPVVTSVSGSLRSPRGRSGFRALGSRIRNQVRGTAIRRWFSPAERTVRARADDWFTHVRNPRYGAPTASSAAARCLSRIRRGRWETTGAPQGSQAASSIDRRHDQGPEGRRGSRSSSPFGSFIARCVGVPLGADLRDRSVGAQRDQRIDPRRPPCRHPGGDEGDDPHQNDCTDERHGVGAIEAGE